MMMTVVERQIANILKNNEKKREQLRKVGERSYYLTTQDRLDVTCEAYNNCIVRFVITGTRAGMVLTVNTLTGEIVRKPRNEKPWHTTYELIDWYKVVTDR